MCNVPLSASWNKGRSKNYPNYFCHKKGCIYQWKVTGREKVENNFTEFLSTCRLDSSVLKLSQEILLKMWEHKRNTHKETLQSATQKRNDLKTKLENLIERISSTTDRDLIYIYEEEVKKINNEIRAIDITMTTNPFNDETFGTTMEKLFNVLEKPVETWRNDDANDKRAVLFAYFSGKVRYDYVEGFGTASLAYPVSLIEDIATSNSPDVEISVESWNHIYNHIINVSDKMIANDYCQQYSNFG
jgi:hypothetical protein